MEADPDIACLEPPVEGVARGVPLARLGDDDVGGMAGGDDGAGNEEGEEAQATPGKGGEHPTIYPAGPPRTRYFSTVHTIPVKHSRGSYDVILSPGMMR